jgi:hypothetical protein
MIISALQAICLDDEDAISIDVILSVNHDVDAIKPSCCAYFWVASPNAVLPHFMDVTVKVRNVFVVVLEKKKIFELVTVPADVISDLVAREAMCRTIIVVQLI